jgi:hypothetical protein
MRQAIKHTRFRQQEAKLLVDRSIRLLKSLSVIPKGTTGRVVDLQEILPGEFDLVIEWDTPSLGGGQRDWFSKDQFDRYLVEARYRMPQSRMVCCPHPVPSNGQVPPVVYW